MNKKEAQSITSDIMIADALLRVKTLENILIAKGLFTREEYNQEMEVVTKQIAKKILEKANVKGNLDDLLLELQNQSKKDPQN
jgi:hypothetical protein